MGTLLHPKSLNDLNSYKKLNKQSKYYTVLNQD